jgi:hypothetical protein
LELQDNCLHVRLAGDHLGFCPGTAQHGGQQPIKMDSRIANPTRIGYLILLWIFNIYLMDIEIDI